MSTDRTDHTVPLRVGDVLYGFCGGAFGRDAYGAKRVEAIGADWVVARKEGGTPLYADCFPEDLCRYRTDDRNDD